MPRHGAEEEKVARLVIQRADGSKVIQNLEPTEDPRAHCRVVWRLAVAMKDIPDTDWYVLPGRGEKVNVMQDEER